jgi:hypothetical protein
MNMNFTLSFTSIKKAFIKFLHRFHVVLFVVIVLGGTAMVIFILNGIVIRSSESDGYTSNTNNTTFDKTTIQRIEELKTRDQTDDSANLPSGRTNPFVE